MERIILRHLKGSKASQSEEFPLATFVELTLGRDPSAQVRFDPEKDDLVGRQHARIARDPHDASRFVVSDLSSRNGTFLNKARVSGSTALSPGDVIQLGAGGPEIEFMLDPIPPQYVKNTRLAMDSAPVMTPMASQGAPPPMTSAVGSAMGNMPPAGSVGKATVERMIGDTKREGNRNMILVGAAVVVIAAIGIFWMRGRNDQTVAAVSDSLTAVNAATRQHTDSMAKAMAGGSGLTPAQIAQKNSNAVVVVEMAWKLIYTPTGGQVYRRLIRNKYKNSAGQEFVYVDNGRQMVPAYVKINENGALEPSLTTDQNEGVAVGSIGSGSGFVVTPDGFIVTNRHVGAPWHAQFQQLDPREDAGPLVDEEGKVLLDDQKLPVIVNAPNNWVPSETKQAGPKGLRGVFEGRMDELVVAFPNNSTRIPAQIARVSDRHDVTLLKISSPQTLPTVEMNDNYETIALGDPVVVMGYPGVSPPKVERIGQKLYGLQEVQVRSIPEPTLSVGNIGKIIRDNAGNQITMFGDSYQLTINSTGAGNSGGPMFDSNGKVTGIYSWGLVTDARISFAVPIRYATELMTVTRPSR